MSLQHENYEILNLIGYGLAKFNNFIEVYGFFSSKSAFYEYCVQIGICETASVVKNRQDLFDHFFPLNGRKGWWQKGDAYIHRKIKIDSLFGNENVESYVNIVKTYLQSYFNTTGLIVKSNPFIKSRFKQMQETGLEAELFFINNFQTIPMFIGGNIDDARLYGDGYDFQISLNDQFYLAEVKGIRESKGKVRLTENEYQKALEYKNKYILTTVLNLNDNPIIKLFPDPLENLEFRKVVSRSKPQNEYHLISLIC
jgi:hypothetical protein